MQPPDSHVTIERLRDQSIVRFSNTQQQQARVYTCVARSRAGEATQSATLVVECKFTCTLKLKYTCTLMLMVYFSRAVRPNMNLTSSHLFAWRGQVRRVTCSSRALPPPTLTWEKDGATVADDVTTNIVTSLQDRRATSTLTVRKNLASLWSYNVFYYIFCIFPDRLV